MRPPPSDRSFARHRALPVLAVLAAFALATTACDESGGDDDELPMEEAYLPALDALEAGRWHTLIPAGDTACARGDTFVFFVWPGTDPALRTDQLFLHFAGGGACWTAQNCAPGETIFPENLEGNRTLISQGASFPGLFDMAAADHPFAGGTQVVVGYCTGDHHIGEVDRDYGDYVLRHRGATNTRAVFDWIEREFDNPSEVIVGGCGAGGYAVPFWLPVAREAFPEATLAGIVDGALGGYSPAVRSQQYATWGASGVGGVDLSDAPDQPALLESLAEAHPEVAVGVVNTRQDAVQTALLADQGSTSWSAHLDAQLQRFDAVPNLATWTADGADHCLAFLDAFFDASAGGVALPAWIATLSDGEPVSVP